jgi:hypothetical protein
MLFDLKNGYVYKVVVANIQEPSLWMIVNEGPVGDGQTVWKNVVTEAEKVYSSSPFLSEDQYITRHLINQRWQLEGHRYCISQPLHEQVCKLEEYSPSTPMTEDFKLRLIKNAVLAAPHLANIESIQEINEHMGSVSAGTLSFNG